MAERVKYFVLGLLFLIVAGVIAYDRWNPGGGDAVADAGEDGWEISVGPRQPLQVAPEQSPPTTVESAPAESSPMGTPFTNERPPIVLKPLPPPSEPRVQPRTPAVPEDRPPPKPKPETKKTVHVIRQGDTLESISMHYYKSRQGIQWIVDANNLENPNRIYENQKLVIPARKEIPRTARTTTTRPKSIPAEYTVKSGDGDLYAICRRFFGSKGEGARVAQIMELNQLWSADVKVGTRLRLPKR